MTEETLKGFEVVTDEKELAETRKRIDEITKLFNDQIQYGLDGFYAEILTELTVRLVEMTLVQGDFDLATEILEHTYQETVARVKEVYAKVGITLEEEES